MAKQRDQRRDQRPRVSDVSQQEGGEQASEGNAVTAELLGVNAGDRPTPMSQRAGSLVQQVLDAGSPQSPDAQAAGSRLQSVLPPSLVRSLGGDPDGASDGELDLGGFAMLPPTLQAAEEETAGEEEEESEEDKATEEDASEEQEEATDDAEGEGAPAIPDAPADAGSPDDADADAPTEEPVAFSDMSLDELQAQRESLESRLELLGEDIEWTVWDIGEIGQDQSDAHTEMQQTAGELDDRQQELAKDAEKAQKDGEQPPSPGDDNKFQSLSGEQQEHQEELGELGEDQQEAQDELSYQQDNQKALSEQMQEVAEQIQAKTPRPSPGGPAGPAAGPEQGPAPEGGPGQAPPQVDTSAMLASITQQLTALRQEKALAVEALKGNLMQLESEIQALGGEVDARTADLLANDQSQAQTHNAIGQAQSAMAAREAELARIEPAEGESRPSPGSDGRFQALAGQKSGLQGQFGQLQGVQAELTNVKTDLTGQLEEKKAARDALIEQITLASTELAAIDADMAAAQGGDFEAVAAKYGLDPAAPLEPAEGEGDDPFGAMSPDDGGLFGADGTSLLGNLDIDLPDFEIGLERGAVENDWKAFDQAAWSQRFPVSSPAPAPAPRSAPTPEVQTPQVEARESEGGWFSGLVDRAMDTARDIGGGIGDAFGQATQAASQFLSPPREQNPNLAEEETGLGLGGIWETVKTASRPFVGPALDAVEKTVVGAAAGLGEWFAGADGVAHDLLNGMGRAADDVARNVTDDRFLGAYTQDPMNTLADNELSALGIPQTDDAWALQDQIDGGKLHAVHDRSVLGGLDQASQDALINAGVTDTEELGQLDELEPNRLRELAAAAGPLEFEDDEARRTFETGVLDTYIRQANDDPNAAMILDVLPTRAENGAMEIIGERFNDGLPANFHVDEEVGKIRRSSVEISESLQGNGNSVYGLAVPYSNTPSNVLERGGTPTDAGDNMHNYLSRVDHDVTTVANGYSQGGAGVLDYVDRYGTSDGLDYAVALAPMGGIDRIGDDGVANGMNNGVATLAIAHENDPANGVVDGTMAELQAFTDSPHGYLHGETFDHDHGEGQSAEARERMLRGGTYGYATDLVRPQIDDLLDDRMSHASFERRGDWAFDMKDDVKVGKDGLPDFRTSPHDGREVADSYLPAGALPTPNQSAPVPRAPLPPSQQGAQGTDPVYQGGGETLQPDQALHLGDAMLGLAAQRGGAPAGAMGDIRNAPEGALDAMTYAVSPQHMGSAFMGEALQTMPEPPQRSIFGPTLPANPIPGYVMRWTDGNNYEAGGPMDQSAVKQQYQGPGEGHLTLWAHGSVVEQMMDFGTQTGVLNDEVNVQTRALAEQIGGGDSMDIEVVAAALMTSFPGLAEQDLIGAGKYVMDPDISKSEQIDRLTNTLRTYHVWQTAGTPMMSEDFVKNQVWAATSMVGGEDERIGGHVVADTDMNDLNTILTGMDTANFSLDKMKIGSGRKVSFNTDEMGNVNDFDVEKDAWWKTALKYGGLAAAGIATFGAGTAIAGAAMAASGAISGINAGLAIAEGDWLGAIGAGLSAVGGFGIGGGWLEHAQSGFDSVTSAVQGDWLGALGGAAGFGDKLGIGGKGLEGLWGNLEAISKHGGGALTKAMSGDWLGALSSGFGMADQKLDLGGMNGVMDYLAAGSGAAGAIASGKWGNAVSGLANFGLGQFGSTELENGQTEQNGTGDWLDFIGDTAGGALDAVIGGNWLGALSGGLLGASGSSKFGEDGNTLLGQLGAGASGLGGLLGGDMNKAFAGFGGLGGSLFGNKTEQQDGADPNFASQLFGMLGSSGGAITKAALTGDWLGAAGMGLGGASGLIGKTEEGETSDLAKLLNLGGAGLFGASKDNWGAVLGAGSSAGGLLTGNTKLFETISKTGVPMLPQLLAGNIGGGLTNGLLGAAQSSQFGEGTQDWLSKAGNGLGLGLGVAADNLGAILGHGGALGGSFTQGKTEDTDASFLNKLFGGIGASNPSIQNLLAGRTQQGIGGLLNVFADDDNGLISGDYDQLGTLISAGNWEEAAKTGGSLLNEQFGIGRPDEEELLQLPINTSFDFDLLQPMLPSVTSLNLSDAPVDMTPQQQGPLDATDLSLFPTTTTDLSGIADPTVGGLDPTQGPSTPQTLDLSHMAPAPEPAGPADPMAMFIEGQMANETNATSGSQDRDGMRYSANNVSNSLATLQDELGWGWTDNEKVLIAMRAMSPKEMSALQQQFQAAEGQSLGDAIASEFSGFGNWGRGNYDTMVEAQNLMRKAERYDDPNYGADPSNTRRSELAEKANALRGVLNGWMATDDHGAAANQALLGLQNKAEVDALIEEYNKRSDVDISYEVLQAELAKKMPAGDYKEAMAHLSGDPKAGAEAAILNALGDTSFFASAEVESHQAKSTTRNLAEGLASMSIFGAIGTWNQKDYIGRALGNVDEKRVVDVMKNIDRTQLEWLAKERPELLQRVEPAMEGEGGLQDEFNALRDRGEGELDEKQLHARMMAISLTVSMHGEEGLTSGLLRGVEDLTNINVIGDPEQMLKVVDQLAADPELFQATAGHFAESKYADDPQGWPLDENGQKLSPEQIMVEDIRAEADKRQWDVWDTLALTQVVNPVTGLSGVGLFVARDAAHDLAGTASVADVDASLARMELLKDPANKAIHDKLVGMTSDGMLELARDPAAASNLGVQPEQLQAFASQWADIDRNETAAMIVKTAETGNIHGQGGLFDQLEDPYYGPKLQKLSDDLMRPGLSASDKQALLAEQATVQAAYDEKKADLDRRVAAMGGGSVANVINDAFTIFDGLDGRDDQKWALQSWNNARLEPHEKIFMGIDGVGTDEELIKEALAGKSEDDIAIVAEKFRRDFGDEAFMSLMENPDDARALNEAALGDPMLFLRRALDTDGVEAIDELLIGDPSVIFDPSKTYTDEERAELAGKRLDAEIRKMDLTYDRATSPLLNFMLNGAEDAAQIAGLSLNATHEQLDYQKQQINEFVANNSAALQNGDAAAWAQFDQLKGYYGSDAADKLAYNDQVGDAASQAIALTAATAATIATGGGASPLMIAAIAAGSGSLAVLAEKGFKGDAMTDEEMMRGFGLAMASGVAAGAGAGFNVALKGKDALNAFAQIGVEEFKAMTEKLTDETMWRSDHRLAAIVEHMGVEGAKAVFNMGVGELAGDAIEIPEGMEDGTDKAIARIVNKHYGSAAEDLAASAVSGGSSYLQPNNSGSLGYVPPPATQTQTPTQTPATSGTTPPSVTGPTSAPPSMLPPAPTTTSTPPSTTTTTTSTPYNATPASTTPTSTSIFWPTSQTPSTTTSNTPAPQAPSGPTTATPTPSTSVPESKSTGTSYGNLGNDKASSGWTNTSVGPYTTTTSHVGAQDGSLVLGSTTSLPHSSTKAPDNQTPSMGGSVAMDGNGNMAAAAQVNTGPNSFDAVLSNDGVQLGADRNLSNGNSYGGSLGVQDGMFTGEARMSTASGWNGSLGMNAREGQYGFEGSLGYAGYGASMGVQVYDDQQIAAIGSRNDGGMYGDMADMMGGTVAAYGLRNGSALSGSATVPIGPASIGVGGSTSDTSLVQFFSAADQAGMDRDMLDMVNGSDMTALLAAEMRNRVDGVEGLSDVDFSQLASGEGFAFEHDHAHSLSGSVAAYGVGASLGLSEQNIEQLIVGRNQTGNIEVSLTAMDDEAYQASLEAFGGVMGIGMNRSDIDMDQVKFIVEDEQAASAALMQFQQTGLLPGADQAPGVDPDLVASFGDKWRQLQHYDYELGFTNNEADRQSYQQAIAERRDELAALSSELNRSFLESSNWNLDDIQVPGIRYESHLRFDQERQTNAISILGNELMSWGTSESEWEQHYRNDSGLEEVLFGYQMDHDKWFGHDETTNVIANPEDAGYGGLQIELGMYTDQHLNTEQRQLLRNLPETAGQQFLLRAFADETYTDTDNARISMAMTEDQLQFLRSDVVDSSQGFWDDASDRTSAFLGGVTADGFFGDHDDQARKFSDHGDYVREQMDALWSDYADNARGPLDEDAFRGQLVSKLSNVNNAEEFAGLAPREQGIVMASYVFEAAQTGEMDPWGAMGMVLNIEDKEVRDMQMRNLFRLVEKTEDGTQATVEFLGYVQQAGNDAGIDQEAMDWLQSGVVVDFLDSRVQDRMGQILDRGITDDTVAWIADKIWDDGGRNMNDILEDGEVLERIGRNDGYLRDKADSVVDWLDAAQRAGGSSLVERALDQLVADNPGAIDAIVEGSGIEEHRRLMLRDLLADTRFEV